MKNKVIAFVLSTLLILNPTITAYAESSINSLQEDVNKANDEIEENNSEINEQSEKIKQLSSEIEQLEGEYESIRTDFQNNEDKIDELNTDIEKKTNEIADLEEEYTKRKELSAPLLQMLQRNNNINYLVEILYSDDVSMVDKINSLHTLNVLSDRTIDKLIKTVKLKEQVTAEKKSLVASKDELKQKQEELKTQGSELLQKSNEETAKKNEALKLITSLKSENETTKNDLLEKNGLIADYKLAGCKGSDVYGVDCGIEPEKGSVSSVLDDYETTDKVNTTGGSYVNKLKNDPNANYIINRESGWNPTAVNASSGAYGICQSLPGNKMESAGSDWRTNIETQAKWCDSYVQGRYGSWAGARAFWDSHNWF